MKPRRHGQQHDGLDTELVKCQRAESRHIVGKMPLFEMKADDLASNLAFFDHFDYHARGSELAQL